MAPAPTIIVTASKLHADDIGSVVALSVLHPEARIWGPSTLADALRPTGTSTVSPTSLPTLLRWARGGRLLVVSTTHSAELGALQSHLTQFTDARCYVAAPSADGDLRRAPLPAAASCTAALVAGFTEASQVPSPAQATAMLSGILARTARLTSAATTAIDRSAAAQCRGWGAFELDPHPVHPAPAASLPVERLHQALGRGWPMVGDLGALAVAQGITPWLVGGGVRDLLQGRPVRDIDVVVEGDAPALAHAAAHRLGGTALAHAPFGTAKWTPSLWPVTEEPIDIATARSETYAQPGALPTVAPATLEDDLYRRDFTLNAMAICLHPDRLGEILDPFNGRRDLEEGVLRVLHDRSFEDDPTRAIRAVRFAARLGLTLAPHTRQLLAAAVGSGVFGALSVDRLGAELDRLLQERDPVVGLRTLDSWGLLPVFHPTWTIDALLLRRLASVMQSWETLVDRDGPLAVPRRADCAWVVLAGGLPPAQRPTSSALIPGTKDRRARFVSGPEPLQAALDALTRDNRPAQVAATLQPLDAVQWLVAHGLSSAHPQVVEVQARLEWWRTRGRHVQSAVDGRWLMAQGHQPSPHFRTALAAAQAAAWNGASTAEQQAAALHVLRTEPDEPQRRD